MSPSILDVLGRGDELRPFTPYAHQTPPARWDDGRIWVNRTGRDGGKTYGASWYTADHALNHAPCHPGDEPHKMAIMAQKFPEARTGCVFGPSGILHHAPMATVVGGRRQAREVHFPNGSVIYLMSAETTKTIEAFRGELSNLCWLWVDELAKYPLMELVIEEMRQAVRAGAARIIVTSTHRRRRKAWLRFLEEPDVDVTRGLSTDNVARRDTAGGRAYQDRLISRADSGYGRQELGLDDDEGDEPGAGWTGDVLDGHRLIGWPEVPVLRGEVVGTVDPADGGRDMTGLAVAYSLPECWCGAQMAPHRRKDGTLETDDHYALESAIELDGRSEIWVPAAAEYMRRRRVDRALVETNGVGLGILGDLIEYAPEVPWQPVGASVSKWRRAEPVARWSRTGRFHMLELGDTEAFENEATSWVPPERAEVIPEAEASPDSPNLIDAVVHSVRALSGLDLLDDRGFAVD